MQSLWQQHCILVFSSFHPSIQPHLQLWETDLVPDSDVVWLALFHACRLFWLHPDRGSEFYKTPVYLNEVVLNVFMDDLSACIFKSPLVMDVRQVATGTQLNPVTPATVCTQHKHAKGHTHTCMHMYIEACRLASKNTCTNVCLSEYVTDTHANTQTHTYTHTHSVSS